MSISKSLCFVLSGVVFLTSSLVRAAEFEYPELLVTPRASERLESEAKREADSRWSRHIPLQVSALTTLTAGIIQTGNYKADSPGSETNKRSAYAGIIAGGGWLTASILLSAYYQPYQSAVGEIGAMARKTPREQLARERYSEEAIERAAAVGTRLTWLSVATNLAASIYMVGHAEKDSIAVVADAVSIGMSLAPLVFPYRWKTVANEQEDYKKKIYAPLAAAPLLLNPTTGRPAAGLALSYQF